MKIWYDACTGKHVRYGTAIAKRLRQRGHEVLFTTREHPDTEALAKILGEHPIVIGKYDPTTLFTRLEESAKRILKLSDLLKGDVPNVAISHQSVELCRVAFGLSVPLILTADTPHATAVNRLTIPFASTLITSEAIPKAFFKKFGAQRIVHFRGVDEVAWIKDFKPLEKPKFEKPVIVVRQMETRAAYALGKEDLTVKLARKLTSLGNVVFLARYGKTKASGLTSVKDPLDSASLISHADIVVSVGGTVSREAALQGVPSIVVSEFTRIPVNEYLSKKGFPLFIVDSSEVFSYVEKYLGKRFNVKTKLAELENPVDIVESVVAEGNQSSPAFAQR